MFETHVSKERNAAKALLMAGALAGLSAGAAWSQPTPAPTTGDLACKAEAQVNVNDTVVSSPDGSGFRSMFNGTFKGWFQSCQTGHSAGNPAGAIFRIGTLGDGTKAIYSTHRNGNVGGVMMTNRKVRNYEIRFQYWSDFGNDAGVFNRTPMNGRCYQTTLDYINGASMGGVWGEGGFVGRDFRPFSFAGNETTISIPGNGQGAKSNWTLITKDIKATTQPNLPCPTAGCTQTDWRALWDANGWNDIRIQFFGGTAANNTITMKSWFKKPASSIWVPLLVDNNLIQVVADGRIGFQVHGGGRFAGPRGTWYRKMRWKPLTDFGASIAPPPEASTGILETEASSPLVANAFGLSGMSDADYSVQVMDAKGRLLETFSGKAGPIDHAFTTQARGLMFLKVKTAHSVVTHRAVRPF